MSLHDMPPDDRFPPMDSYEEAVSDALGRRRMGANNLIKIPNGGTSAAVDETLEMLRNDVATYDFGGQLAKVESGKVWPLSEAALAHHLGGLIEYVKFNSKDSWEKCDPPFPLIKQILALNERRDLKPLDAVVTCPTIRADGTLLASAGYDAATRLFLHLPQHVPSIPDAPTIDQAKDALKALLRPFKDFPLIDGGAKSALVSALLTAIVRPVLPTAPAHAFDAPVQGSGKTLLAQCVGALAEGVSPSIWPHTKGRDDEETRKRLFTALAGGARSLIWDNIVGVFDSASMAAVITSPVMTDRILGKSEAVSVPNKAMLILTGNNLSLTGDMPRRVLICRIDPQTDEPFAREFSLDPLAFVIEHRQEMAVAACTLIRARFVHAFTHAPGRMASFEVWDDLVRQTIIFCRDVLGCGSKLDDPMDLIREAQSADPERDALSGLLLALKSRFGTAQFTAREVLDAVQAGSEIAEALADATGDQHPRSAKSVGRTLSFRKDRIADGLCIVMTGDRTKKFSICAV